MSPEQESFFEQLYYEHFGTLKRRADANFGASPKAQELVQDTFHEAFRNIDDLMKHSNPIKWLNKTLSFKILESYRSNKRESDIVSFLMASPSVQAMLSGRRETELLALADPPLTEQIAQVLTPEDCRHFLRLYLDGASHHEVAEEFNITVYNSYKRVERSKKKLKKALSELNPKNKK